MDKKDVSDRIVRHMKSDSELLLIYYMCAKSERVKNAQDFHMCCIDSTLQALGGRTSNTVYSQGNKVIFPLDDATIKMKHKAHIECLKKLNNNKYQNESELDKSMKNECPYKSTDILKTFKR